jgi:hypothetical protein
MDAFKKHVFVGYADAGRYPVFVTINWTGERLSLTDVVGPKSNGDARGSCGQIDLRAVVYDPPEGVDVERLAEIWKAWHLNDMRAGCLHQRVTWDLDRTIDVVTYSLTREARDTQQALQRRTLERLAQGDTVTWPEDARALMALPLQTKVAPAGADVGRYEETRRETKHIGHARPEEGGLLGAPCEVCGYKYGTAWLKETVPEAILEELRALPETDRLPACWR